MAEWKTRWKCNKCGASDTVVHDDDEGHMTVLHLIEESHEAKSPDCTPFNYNSIIVAMVAEA